MIQMWQQLVQDNGYLMEGIRNILSSMLYALMLIKIYVTSKPNGMNDLHLQLSFILNLFY